MVWLNLRLSAFTGQSGRDRRRWDSSCWRKQETIPRCRGCSRPRISTRRAWCPTWTPEQPSTCTEAPLRPRPPCRDPWSRGSCCTACREAASRPRLRLLCPQCQACYPGQVSSGEPAPADHFPTLTKAALDSFRRLKQRHEKT